MLPLLLIFPLAINGISFFASIYRLLDLDLENFHILILDAGNVVGLGASVVACDIINSINDSLHSFSINNIYLPPASLCHYSSDLPTNVALHFSKSILPRRLQRIFLFILST